MVRASDAIVVKGLCASRGKGNAARQVLQHVNLNVPRGTLHMLVGPNGCGKVANPNPMFLPVWCGPPWAGKGWGRLGPAFARMRTLSRIRGAGTRLLTMGRWWTAWCTVHVAAAVGGHDPVQQR